jgi:histidinol-phosphate aminotransferase
VNATGRFRLALAGASGSPVEESRLAIPPHRTAQELKQKMTEFLRPSVRGMAGYVPGEQPREAEVIKLNTNENPYPPSPRVAEAIGAYLTTGALRKYPDPTGTHFRQVAARTLGGNPEGILIGNGSDDILTILTRAFVPEGGLVVSPSPSYLLYRTLAEIQGGRLETVPYTATWGLPSPWPIKKANLTFVANPNSPSGTFVALSELTRLAREIDGPLVIDEAYVDFAEENALSLVRLGNVIVTRTLSKSYSLAGLRFGFAVAPPELVRELIKVKDSYNCDTLSLIGAAAALEDQAYMRETRAKILATRRRLDDRLSALGFQVQPSHANFVWARRADRPVKAIYEELKRRHILVRYMNYPGYGDGLRVSVGLDVEVDRLLEELARIA